MIILPNAAFELARTGQWVSVSVDAPRYDAASFAAAAVPVRVFPPGAEKLPVPGTDPARNMPKVAVFPRVLTLQREPQ